MMVQAAARSCNGDTLHSPTKHRQVVLKEDERHKERTVLLTKMTTMGNEENDEIRVKNGSTFTLGTGSDITLDRSSDDLDPSCCGKTKRFFKVTYTLLRSLVGMIIILIAYSFLGAYIFMKIESKHEIQYKTNISDIRDRLLQESFNLSKTVQTETEWRRVITQTLVEYEEAVKEAKANGVISPSDEIKWDFWGSLFFVGTIYTTIGYGNISPSTKVGRLVCILYAGIGIPLALLVLAELGKRITIGLKILWAFVRRWYYRLNCGKVVSPGKQKYGVTVEDPVPGESGSQTPEVERSRSGSRVVYGYEIDEEFDLPILVAVTILVVYIICGSIMYSFWENWDAVTAVYFVFVSLSTIGFGDILPAHPKFFMISFVYIFIGLSLVSMVITVAIQFFSHTVEKAKAKMEQAKEKMDKAKQKVKDKVNLASKTAKDRVTELKDNIKDETAKIIHKKDDRYKKRSTSRSRSNTPVSFESPFKESSPEKSIKARTKEDISESCDDVRVENNYKII